MAETTQTEVKTPDKIENLVQCSRIHVLLYEKTKEDFCHGLTKDIIDSIEFHNFSDDPLGWNGGDISYNTSFWSTIASSRRLDSVGIVIDSLSNLILYRSVAYTCKTLHNLRNPPDSDVKVTLVCLLHEDLHDEIISGKIRHLADTCIRLRPPKDKSYHATCHVLHKKTSGKITRQIEQIKFQNNYVIQDTKEVLCLNETTLVEDMTKAQLDPAANLPFNLTLTDGEKAARQKVELPYIHKHSRSKQQIGSSVAGTGKIFYQPDEADDFDEDDPDDDLDV